MTIVFEYSGENMLPFIMILHSGLKTDFPEAIMKLQTGFGSCCFFTYSFILLSHVMLLAPHTLPPSSPLPPPRILGFCSL